MPDAPSTTPSPTASPSTKLSNSLSLSLPLLTSARSSPTVTSKTTMDSPSRRCRSR
ncbi:hypothetical protein LINGRAHAP2_LOCUS29149 [Linum grandiflorum]